MGCLDSTSFPSPFILENVNRLLMRYSLSYCEEGQRIEYFITDRLSGEDVSFSLVLTNNIFSHRIHICKFYPGLYRQTRSKYLSAATFFLIVHHFAQHYAIGTDYTIFLQSQQTVYSQFYSTLKDFSFRIIHEGQGMNVNVFSPFHPHDIDTSMIRPRAMHLTDDQATSGVSAAGGH